MRYSERQPVLLNSNSMDKEDLGSLDWDPSYHPDRLSISDEGRTVEWNKGPSQSEEFPFPPAWLGIPTRMHLHSGEFQWDFQIEKMGRAQIGVGFMLLWDVGPDWGFFGYLGASNSAWAYDPSTGDVVRATRSIQGGLPKLDPKKGGTVSVYLNLPGHEPGFSRFEVRGTQCHDFPLPAGSVVLPAACLLTKSQRVTLTHFLRVT